MKSNSAVIGIVIAVVFMSAGFFGGMKYQAGQAPARGTFAGGGTFGGTGGASARGARTGGAGAVFGTIIAKDATGVTVKLGGANATSTNGTATGSKIILVSETTQISKMTAGSASDLTLGETIIATGTTNTDGSVTAATIQVRPTISR